MIHIIAPNDIPNTCIESIAGVKIHYSFVSTHTKSREAEQRGLSYLSYDKVSDARFQASGERIRVLYGGLNRNACANLVYRLRFTAQTPVTALPWPIIAPDAI